MKCFPVEPPSTALRATVKFYFFRCNRSESPATWGQATITYDVVQVYLEARLQSAPLEGITFIGVL